MMKALKDISKNQKKSTSTRAPVAEPSLFISTKSKGPRLDTRNPLDEDLGPIFDEEDEPDPVFDEEATSITSIIMESHLCFDPDTTPVHLTPDLQEHLFVLSIQERQVQPLRNESIDCAQQPKIWRSFVVQTDYLGDASDMGSVKNGYLNIQKVFCHESNFPGKPTNQGFTEAWNHLNIFTDERVMNFPNRRFSSSSIREYHTSKGDSGPKKKQPEPKPILNEKRCFLSQPPVQTKSTGRIMG
ncbi:hypothetical protein F2Q70_00043788 [Brassica cretica]|uniref:Uncharacterized protein n=1 Tax=Brassica cretica TaxID=69181 RepID=A0A8S9KK00_BRACR|nr:hypothetical protein F2Q70_00043788 [Brassica cretica]